MTATLRSIQMAKTTPEHVEKAVSHYAVAEKALRAAHKALLALPAEYEGVRINGAIGFLEASRRSAAAQVSAGKVAEALASVIAAHESDTARAQELGIDVPAPGGIVIMSGGR